MPLCVSFVSDTLSIHASVVPSLDHHNESWISGSILHTSAKVFFFTSGHILHWLPAQYNLHNTT